MQQTFAVGLLLILRGVHLGKFTKVPYSMSGTKADQEVAVGTKADLFKSNL